MPVMNPNEGLAQATYEQLGVPSIVTSNLGLVAFANDKGRQFLNKVGLKVGERLCSTLCPALLGMASGALCLDCPAITGKPNSRELVMGNETFSIVFSPIKNDKKKPPFVNHIVYNITEQVREKRGRELLNEVLSIFNKSASSREVLVQILETAEKFVPYRTASILELDGIDGQTDITLIQRKKNSHGKPIITAKESSMANPLIKKVISLGKPIIFDSIKYPDHLMNLPRNKNVRWYLATPIVSEGKIIGILILDSDKKNNPFTKDHIADLQPFSLIAGNALRREKENEKHRFTDKLTGLYNRTYMRDRLDQEINKAKRKKTPLAVVMADIDHFKQFNDKYGHLAGDEVLRKLGDFIKKTLRRSDIACRFGGEELLFIFSDTTTEQTKMIALKIQKKLKHLIISYGHKRLPKITLSMGITTFSENVIDQDYLLLLADQALYAAKGNGRGQINILENGKFIEVVDNPATGQ